jgi:hypothetical protein
MPEKTIEETGWKQVDRNERRATLGGIRFSVLRVRAGLWKLRKWDPDNDCWVDLLERERGWASWDLERIAKQMAWRIIKSKG